MSKTYAFGPYRYFSLKKGRCDWQNSNLALPRRISDATLEDDVALIFPSPLSPLPFPTFFFPSQPTAAPPLLLFPLYPFFFPFQFFSFVKQNRNIYYWLRSNMTKNINAIIDKCKSEKQELIIEHYPPKTDNKATLFQTHTSRKAIVVLQGIQLEATTSEYRAWTSPSHRRCRLACVPLAPLSTSARDAETVGVGGEGLRMSLDST